MTPVSLKEARKHLGDLVGAVERGETVVITRRGRRVARLVSAAEEPQSGLPDLSSFRKSLKLKGRGLTDELLAMRREERA